MLCNRWLQRSLLSLAHTKDNDISSLGDSWEPVTKSLPELPAIKKRCSFLEFIKAFARTRAGDESFCGYSSRISVMFSTEESSLDKLLVDTLLKASTRASRRATGSDLGRLM